MASVIQLILEAKNYASPTLKQIASDLQSLDKSVGTLNKIATLDLGLTGLQAAFSTIQQITQAVADTSQAGAQYDRLAKSFGNLAAEHNVGGQAIVSAIDEVTQGTLSYQTIMQQANNAMLLGVADTADEFSTLAKIAVDRGRAMGISMEYAFESIVKGVGRLSPLILDNLGIVLDADKTYGEFAKTLGKAADDLTDAEKRMALLERLKQEVANFDSSQVLDAAGSWEKFTASIANATAETGNWINKNTQLPGILNAISDAIDDFSTSSSSGTAAQLKEIDGNIEEAVKKVHEFQKAKADFDEQWKNADDFGKFWLSVTNDSSAALDTWTEKLDALVKKRTEILTGGAGSSTWNMAPSMLPAPEISAAETLDAEYAKISDTLVNRYAKAAGLTNEKSRENIQIMIQQRGSYESAAQGIMNATLALEAFKQKTIAVNGLISGTLSGIESAALQAFVDSGYNTDVIESYKAIKTEVEGLETTLKGMDETDAKFYMKQVGEEGQAGFNAITEYANESGKSIGGVATKTKQLTKEFQDLQSTVGSIVSSAYSDIGGADLSQFLPYQDQPGEDAKRIASVMVEGWDSEWVDYFKNKFPDLFSQYMGEAGGDIQAASAMLLKDFQDGLRPELLDKDKIKDLAKRMFLADQETSKMVDEIAQELAKELNITIEEAQAAVGGAAGIKKKIPTKEEIDKILGENNMTPKWKMDGAREKFVEAGKAAGLLDENGYLFVDVAIKMGASGAIEGDYKLQISSFTFEDKKTLIENLQKATAINLLFTPWLPATFATDFENNVASKIPKTTALQVVPAALDIEKWNNFITGLEGAVSQVDFSINPSMSTEDFENNVASKIPNTTALEVIPAALDIEKWNNFIVGLEGAVSQVDFSINPSMLIEDFESLFAPIRTALAEGFVTQETLDLMVFNLSAGLGMTILQNEDSFTPNGALVAAFIINKFNETNVGMMMANSLATQLQQAEKTFQTSAENSGKVWGDAFLKMVQANVPIELVRILSELVTPQVQQKANAEKNRGESE